MSLQKQKNDKSENFVYIKIHYFVKMLHHKHEIIIMKKNNQYLIFFRKKIKRI